MKEKKPHGPNEILESMKKERPQLYKNFRPSAEQVAYFIVSNSREFMNVIDQEPNNQAVDSRRITRSIKSVTPGEKFPASLDEMPKKRDKKNQ